MRDLSILFLIITFWTVFGLGSLLMNSDTSLNLNSTYDYSLNMPQIAQNTSDDSYIPLFSEGTTSKTKQSVNFLVRFAAFGVPEDSRMPAFIIYLIASLNTTLALVSLLIVYRLIRHGGG
jgi:hypothetical protein